MSVTTDLQTSLSAHRRFFLRIDGLNYNLMQDTRHPGQTEAEPIQAVTAGDTNIMAAITEDEVRRSTDGTTWAAENSTGTSLAHGMHGTSASDVWMCAASQVMHHWDGNAWSKETLTGATGNLEAVYAISTTDVWAVSSGGTSGIWHYNGSSWTLNASAPTGISYRGVYCPSTGIVFACGALTSDSNAGRILRWDGATWTTQVSISTGGFRGIWGVSDSEVYAVGDQGLSNSRLYTYDGATWTNSTGDLPDSSAVCYDVSGVDGSNVWIAALDKGGGTSSEGVIFKYNGSTWSTVYTDASANTALQACCAIDSSNVYFVGQNGRIVYHNGTTYVTQTSGTSNLFDGVYGALTGAATWDRSALNCLQLPSVEWHQELNLADMTAQWSSMTFQLSDIPDPDSEDTSYFGKLFAPGRWDSSTIGRTYLVRQDVDDQEIVANATTIPVANTDGFTNFATSGVAYLGGEAFSYTGKSTSTTTTGFASNIIIGEFTGVKKGIYPAYDNPRGASTDSLGKAFRYSPHTPSSPNDIRDQQGVSSVPFSWLGRDVGLYVTTYNDASKRWHYDNEASLIWAGKISDSISYNPESASWGLACESQLSTLDRVVGSDLPQGMLANLINLNGDIGRSFRIALGTVKGGYNDSAVITVPKGYYSWKSLAKEVADRLNDSSNWSLELGVDFEGVEGFVIAQREQGSGGKTAASMRLALSGIVATLASQLTIQITGYDDQAGAMQMDLKDCHVLRALGFGPGAVYAETGADDDLLIWGSGNGYQGYHPVTPDANGGKLALLTSHSDALLADQGDAHTAVSYFGIQDAHVSGLEDKKEWYVDAYTAITETSAVVDGHTRYFTELTLVSGNDAAFIGGRGGNGFAAIKELSNLETWPTIKNIYLPTFIADSTFKSRGPFTNLLHSLVSTGVTSHNGVYDVLASPFGIGFPSALIDTQSFVLADSTILAAYPELSDRKNRFFDKGVSWMEWAKEEMSVFGYALVWESGKIKLKDIFRPNIQDTAVTLTEANTWAIDDYPQISLSMDNVINEYEFDCGWDVDQRKLLLKIVISDRYSKSGLGITKKANFKNRGLVAGRETNESPAIKELIISMLEGRFNMLRMPWQKMSRTLSADLFNQVFVGDVVSIVHSKKHPDPFGGGSNAFTGKGIITDVSWNLEEMKGSCEVLIYSRYSTAKSTPWGPSGLVDVGATNAGIEDASNYITLVQNKYGITGDSHDGEAFLEGDKILIIERDPVSPTSGAPGNKWSATVAAAAYTTGNRRLQLETVDLSALDTTGANEYIITFADYDVATTSMKTRGAWAADPTTLLIDGTDEAYRWG